MRTARDGKPWASFPAAVDAKTDGEVPVADLPILRSYPGFEALPAAQRGEVYVVDGSAYFSRPGPRIADSLEILAEILHPERFSGRFPDRAAARVG